MKAAKKQIKRNGPSAAKPSVSQKSTFGDDSGTSSRSGVPVYYKIYVLMAQKIRDGEWVENEVLPSESEMTAEYGVSRVTVRKALKQLEDENLVIRRRGARSLVAPLPKKASSPLIQGPVDNLLTRGLAAEAQNLEIGWVTPPTHALEALRLAADTKCFLLRRLRHHADEPFSYSRVYVAPEAAVPLANKPLGNDPVLVHLERAGMLASCADQTISATLAQNPAASALRIPLGSALIQLRRIVFDDAGVPCIYQISLYRPDKFEYFMRLSRESATLRPQWRHI